MKLSSNFTMLVIQSLYTSPNRMLPSVQNYLQHSPHPHPFSFPDFHRKKTPIFAIHFSFPRAKTMLSPWGGAAAQKTSILWLVHVTPVPQRTCAHVIFNVRACSHVYDNGAWQTAFHAGFLSLGHIKRTRVNFVYTWLFAC